MSKILTATCQANVVKIEGKPVTATILSKGVGASTGVAVIEDDQVTYLTSSSSDIEALITALGTIIDKIVLIATGVDAASNAPGGQTANITALTLLKTQMVAQKDGLK